MNKNIKIFILAAIILAILILVITFTILQKPGEKSLLNDTAPSTEEFGDIGTMTDNVYVKLITWQILNFHEYKKNKNSYEEKWQQILDEYKVSQDNFDNFNRQLGHDRAEELQKQAILEVRKLEVQEID